MGEFGVTVGAGSLRSAAEEAVRLPHRWTDGGVTVEATFTGAHLFHLSVAGCVLNDVYREAKAAGIAVAGVRVHASGTFKSDTWASSGVEYSVELDADASASDVSELVRRVDEVAEIPRAIRQGAPVRRTAWPSP
ncbi:MAG: OsmC family protein [Jatrophihabitantaceae bacterium]